jgi:hypothetical protein
VSKLSKFKGKIPVNEAAELLSRLIGESVDTKELEILYTNGWLTASHNCLASLVKLEPMLDEEQHAIQVQLGNYNMQEGEDSGICFGIDLPADQVYLKGHGRVYTLRDEAGNHYALRDKHSEQYLGESNEEFLYFEECEISPNEIYSLAEMANNDQTLQPAKLKILENANCVSMSAGPLYNFKPGDDRFTAQLYENDSKLINSAKALDDDKPSYILTIGAMLSIVLDDKKIRSQGELSGEIEAKFKGIRGLGKKSVDTAFAAANSALRSASDMASRN